MDFIKAINQKGFNLSEERISLIGQTKTNTLVQAVPGSGKTTLIVCRSAYLMSEHHVPGNRILNLTFNKSTATAMKHMFLSLFGENEEQKLRFRTIYSYCYHILRKLEKAGIWTLPKLIEDSTLLRHLYFEANGQSIEWEQINILERDISYVKSNILDEEEINHTKWELENFPDIYSQYCSYCVQNNLMDYEDILCYTLDFLKNNQEILAEEQSSCDFVNVDEAQSFSKLQCSIIDLISTPDKNFFVFADYDLTKVSEVNDCDFQLKSMIDYDKILVFEDNYRSIANIVLAANRLLKYNFQSITTAMRPVKPLAPSIKVKAVPDRNVQWDYIVSELKNEKKLSDIALMYRHNYSLMGLVDTLHKNKIPFSILSDGSSRFRHWVIKDILDFCSLLQDKSDKHAFERLYYKIGFGISKQIMRYLMNTEIGNQDIFEVAGNMPDIKPLTQKKVKSVAATIGYLSKLLPYHVIGGLESDLDYNKYLENNCSGEQKDIVGQIILAIKEIARKTRTLPEFVAKMNNINCLIEEGGIIEDDYVNIIDMDSCSGREFKKVILFDLVDDEFPCTRFDIEHEAGLFYSAVTRPSHMVEMIFPIMVAGRNCIPTRFVGQFIGKPDIGIAPQSEDRRQVNQKMLQYQKNIKRFQAVEDKNENSEEVRKFSIGEMVKHVKFGEGKVKKLDRETIVIEFDCGEKALSIQFCSNPKIMV